MYARLIRDFDGNVKLLCKNGTIDSPTMPVLANILTNFKAAKYFSGNDGRWSDNYADMMLYPGIDLAYVTDDLTLVVLDGSVFTPVISETLRMSSYINITEYAKKVNRSREIIKVLCREGRIVGAQKIGNQWMIPEDAPYPIPPNRRRPGSGPRAKQPEEQVEQEG